MDLRKSITFAGISSSVLFALTSILSGLFTRWGLWDFRTGLSVLKWSAIGEAATVIAASAACIITLYRKTWDLLIISILAFIISTASVGVPLKWFLSARRVPPIHDITTDTENPPQFATILKLRENASNPSGYGGPDISSKQLAVYPDIRPALLNVPPEKAFDICLATVREMGGKSNQLGVSKIYEQVKKDFYSTYRTFIKNDETIEKLLSDGKASIS